MADYYVADSDGNNNYNGLYPAYVSGLDGPWKTIDYAVSQVIAGDFVNVRTGTYGAITIGSADGGGSAGLPITIRNYQSEVVTIDGGASQAVYCNAAKYYYTWDGLIFDSNNEYVVEADDYNRVFGGINFWIVQNCTIKGQVEWYGHDWQFLHNEVDGTGFPTPVNGVSCYSGNGDGSGDLSYNNLIHGNTIHDFTERGINLSDYSHDCMVTDNIIYNIAGGTYEQGIDADGYGKCQYGHIISGNIVHDVEMYGIQLENVCYSTVENNIIYDCGVTGPSEGAFYVMAYSIGVVHDGYGATNFKGYDAHVTIRQNLIYDNVGDGIEINSANGVLIEGNTIAYNGKSGIYFLAESSGQNNACDVIGNLLAQNNGTTGEGEIEFNMNMGTQIDRDDYNLIYPKNGKYAYHLDISPWTDYTLAQYKSAIGKGLNSVEDDPDFLNVAGDDYHLKSSSPAINIVPHGETGKATDYDGIPRGRGTSDDAGCYETLKGGPRGL